MTISLSILFIKMSKKNNWNWPSHWEKIISVAHKNAHRRKLLEAMIIRLHKPSLNEQLETKSLILFRNGVTWDPFSN